MNVPSLIKEKHSWKQFLYETPYVLSLLFFLTAFLVLFHLSTRVPDSLLLYFLAILFFACFCGLRAALLASLVAFVLFDYLFVPPVYGFGATKFEDIFGLFVFLLATLITSQLASSFRSYALQAHQREYETRTIYEFVRATNRENIIGQQMTIFAQSLLHVFTTKGLLDCMVFLPDNAGKLQLQGHAHHSLEQLPFLLDEEEVALWSMKYGRPVDLYDPSLSSVLFSDAFRGQKKGGMETRYLIRLLPLQTETKSYGVLRLLIEEKRESGEARNSLGLEFTSSSAQSRVFSTFLEQAVAVIEQQQLREDSIHLEVMHKTEGLRSALFSSVSHDLRTPLATIKATIGNLLQEEGFKEHPAYMRRAVSMQHEVDRLDAWVENVLDMSRIEAGSLRLEKVWYPFPELVCDTINRMEPLLEMRPVHLYYPQDLPPVEIDYVQMEQVLFNLVENAIRYTPKGAAIEIHMLQQESSLQVSIVDHGPGIPAEEQGHIFEKFYRLPPTHGRQQSPYGLGLGLAICQGIIQAHEGRIWVETSEEGGAIFCFTLPISEIKESEIDE